MTHTLKRLILLPIVFLLSVVGASAQYRQLVTTTTAAAITTTTNQTIALTSVTGVAANSTTLWVEWEAMAVTRVNTTASTVNVIRGSNGTRAQLHATAATVIVLVPPATVTVDPVGACTLGQGLALYQPIVNTSNGNISNCRSSAWKATNVQVLTYNSITTSP